MKKTLLVGLDAACWEYLDPLLQAGRLPTIQKLIDSGALGVLDSTMPAWTPTAWSSLVTAKNPGKHGVFDMLWRKPGDYELKPVNAKIRQGTPFWKYLNDAGLRVGLVNIPFTHPPEPLEGFAVCGFGTPDSARNLTWPPEALARIEDRFGSYKPVVSTEMLETGTPEGILASEIGHQAQMVRIAASLAEQYDVHVLAINLMLTDHANHKMPRMELVHEAYIQSDADIGALLAAFQPDNVLLISDHGSSRLKGDFLLNVWLQEHGFCVYGENNLGQQNGALDWILRQWLQGHLGWSGRPAKVLRRAIRNVLPRLPRAMQRQFWTRIEKVIPFAESHVRLSTKPDYNRTAVFPGSLYSGLLYFNVSSPTLSGPIPAQDRISLAAKLKGELADVREPDTGEPLFANVYSSSELYSGPAVRDAPDVVLDAFRSQWNIRTRQPAPFKGKQHSRYFITFDEKRDFGWHSPEGVFVFSGPAFRPGRASNAACLMDVPATLLHLYGVPVPEDWDGQVLVDLLTSELGQRPVRSQPGDAEPVSVQDDGLSEEEADSLVSHLRALGYLD